MNIENQARLGYSQMKAAIIGAHNLMDAFCELAAMTHNGKIPNVVVGGLGCLLYCTEVLSRAGLLPVVPEDCLNEFLHADYSIRVEACTTALEAGDMFALGKMVSVMTSVIDMNRALITFKGDMPSVAEKH